MVNNIQSVLPLLVLGLMLCTAQQQLPIWPQSGYDGTHSSQSTSFGPPTTPRTAWAHSFTYAPSTPAIGTGTIFVTTAKNPPIDGCVYALDNRTGNVLWSDCSLENSAYSPALNFDGSTVYVSKKGLRALSSQSGNLLWERTDIIVAGPPVVGPGIGIIYVLSAQPSGLYATMDGHGLWMWSCPEPIAQLVGPAFTPDESTGFVISYTSGSVYGVSSGDTAWSMPNVTAVSMAVGPTLLYILKKQVISAVKFTGTPVWSQTCLVAGVFDTRGGISSDVHGRVYVVGPQGMCSLSSSNGIQMWTLTLAKISAGTGTRLIGPPVIDGAGKIHVTYLGASGGGVAALSPTGDVLWNWKLDVQSPSLSSPVIGGSGRIYVSGGGFYLDEAEAEVGSGPSLYAGQS